MRAWVGVLVAALALVAGCGESDDEPRVLPSLAASASPSASPSPSPVPTGAAAAEDAAAFARFVYAEIERAFIERDPTLVEAISMPSCESCQNFIKSIAGVRDTNGRVEGYRITVHFAVAPADTGTTARVDVVRDSTGGTFVDASGRVVNRQAPLRGIEEQMDLIRVGGVWKVADIERVRVRG